MTATVQNLADNGDERPDLDAMADRQHTANRQRYASLAHRAAELTDLAEPLKTLTAAQWAAEFLPCEPAPTDGWTADLYWHKGVGIGSRTVDGHRYVVIASDDEHFAVLDPAEDMPFAAHLLAIMVGVK